MYLEELYDQGLHCLLFQLYILEPLSLNFGVLTAKLFAIKIVRSFSIIHFKHVYVVFVVTIEPRREKTSLQGFQPGPTQTGLYNQRRWLDARNFGFRK